MRRFYRRLSEIENIVHDIDPQFKSSIESANAGLWLIAGELYSQAIVSYINAIEIVVKIDLKSNISNNSEIIQKINFSKALNEIFANRPELSSNWKNQLDDLRVERNNIVHQGNQPSKNGDYCKLLALVAIPFYVEYFREVSQIDYWDVADVDASREISTAKKICSHLEGLGQNISPYIFLTTKYVMLFSKVQWPTFPEGLIGLSEGDLDIQLSEWNEYLIKKEWGEQFVKIECRICDHYPAFAKIIKDKTNSKPHWLGKIPIEVVCPKCGLEIRESDLFLAETHIKEWNGFDDVY